MRGMRHLPVLCLRQGVPQNKQRNRMHGVQKQVGAQLCGPELQQDDRQLLAGTKNARPAAQPPKGAGPFLRTVGRACATPPSMRQTNYRNQQAARKSRQGQRLCQGSPAVAATGGNSCFA